MEVTQLGKYEVRKTIGRGAVGIVYEAWDPVMARTVAIKTLPLSYMDEEGREQYERFKREAQAAARLHHPNIVSAFDYGETASSAYIVMEFLSGPSLKALLAKREPLDLPDIVKVMQGLLAGLQHSHRRGVVHRDIKPANIVFSDDDEVKITDFGIAHLESSSMTRVGSVIGTPAYMAPEQVLGEPVDARTDVYSAGVVFYEMLTGRRPFEGSETSVMHKIVNAEPPRPSQQAPTLSPRIDAIIAKAIAKDPADRYQSAAELADALRAELTPAPTSKAAPAELVDASEATVAMHRAPPPPPIPPAQASPPPFPPAETPATPAAATPAARNGRMPWPVLLAGTGVLGLAAVAWLTLSPAGPRQSDGSHAAKPSPAPAIATVVTPPPVATPPAAPPVATTPASKPPTAEPTSPTQPASLPAQPATSPREPLRQQVAAIVASAPCSVVTTEVAANNQVRLRGLHALGEASELEIQATLQRAIQMAAPGTSVTWDMRRVDGPYCQVFDLLRPLAGSPGRSNVSLSLPSNQPRVSDGERVRLAVEMPGPPARLTLDWFASDGTVRHLHAGPSDGSHPYIAGSWKAGNPYGDQLITALVSPGTLLPQDRPDREPAETYLKDLQSALARQTGDEARAAADVLTLNVVSP